MSFSLNPLFFERLFEEKMEKSTYCRNLFVFLLVQSVMESNTYQALRRDFTKKRP